MGTRYRMESTALTIATKYGTLGAAGARAIHSLEHKSYLQIAPREDRKGAKDKTPEIMRGHNKTKHNETLGKEKSRNDNQLERGKRLEESRKMARKNEIIT